jgi:hypothetical protein
LSSLDALSRRAATASAPALMLTPTLIASDVLQTVYHLQRAGAAPSRTHNHHQKKAIHA